MTFKALGLMEPLIQAVAELGYTEPSPIQQKAIVPILQGRDVLASAQTGTGKTASFVLPILQRLNDLPPARANGVKALIITPTRELAAQVHACIAEYGVHLKQRTAAVFGGVKINPQMMKLRGGVEILVATPGRLMDLFQQRALKFDELTTLVLDEADRMLDMGFIHDIQRIVALLPKNRQTLLFSATFSDSIRRLAKNIMQQPLEIDVAPRNATAVLVNEVIYPVDKARKFELLTQLIQQHAWAQTLIFVRTKHGANKLVKQLNAAQFYAVAIHGDRSQSQRTKALAAFKSGEIHILVATDIAARGIDIDLLPCVVNFDLSTVAEDYVHRIGRTARAGQVGMAISLVSADEVLQLQAIEKLLKRAIKRVVVDGFEPVHALPNHSDARSKPVSKPHRDVKSRQRNTRR